MSQLSQKLTIMFLLVIALYGKCAYWVKDDGRPVKTNSSTE